MEENQIIVDIGLDAFIESLRHLQKQYELNTAALKAMKDAGEEQSNAYITLTQEQKVLRQQMASTEKSIQNEIKMQQAQEGSLVQLRSQLANLNKQYDSMSGMERMGKSGEELQTRIKALHDQILGLEGDTGRMQRNVGNYPEAIKPVTAQLREMTQELIRLRVEGKQNTAEYNELLKKTGELKDSMADAQREVKQMASDTGTLNTVMDAAKLTTGAFSAALGVFNLIGDKDSKTAKELAEAQRKLQAAIAVTTGLQAVQNTLQKESALMMGVAKLQALAAAKAQDGYAAATGRATIAQGAFNAIAKANPYVLLAAGIASVVGAIALFVKGSEEQEEQTKETNYELQKQVDIIDKLTKGYAELNRKALSEAEYNLELKKAEGASIEEIRAAEDALYNERLKALNAEGEGLKEEVKLYKQWSEKYKQDLKEIDKLQKQRSQAILDGADDEAKTYDYQIKLMQDRVEEEKRHLDLVDSYRKKFYDFEVARSEQLRKRDEEDEERRKKSADEAKKRHEENIKRLRQEREELKKLGDKLDSSLAKLKTVTTFDLSTRQAQEELDAFKKKWEEVKKAIEDVEMEQKIWEQAFPKGTLDKLADKLERASNPLYDFSQTYKENAEAIMETSSALESSFGSLSSMYQAMARDESKSEEERAEAARKAKAWAKVQIATNAATAVAKGVASAVDVGFPAAIPAMATMLAAILSAIAQAKALASEAGSYEHGGVIGNKFIGATRGKDDVTITARRGEMMLNADQQKRLYDIANGGENTNLTASLVEALQAMPAPVLVYSEFQRFTDRVATLDDAAKLK